MDRGTWQATVHGIAELDTTEQLTLLLLFMLKTLNASYKVIESIYLVLFLSSPRCGDLKIGFKNIKKNR